ncbi:hypothetical protein G9A89_022780 [Geosiphon pyriformis]|nr:hypothetical protein G9A89_022780 [Geosiphon pyriformis]
MAVAKGFVLKDWLLEACDLCDGKSAAVVKVVNFVRGFAVQHRLDIWVPNASLRRFYETNGLLSSDDVVFSDVCGLSSRYSDKDIRSLGFIRGILINFGTESPLS